MHRSMHLSVRQRDDHPHHALHSARERLRPAVLPVRADRLVDLVDDAVRKDQRREADGGGDLAERDEDGLLLGERADGVWQPRDDGRQRLGYAALAEVVDVDVITFVRSRSLLKCLSVCRWMPLKAGRHSSLSMKTTARESRWCEM